MNAAPPKFRNDVRMRRQASSQGTWYVVKDPATDKFFRFREAEQFIASQLDGETSLDVVRERTKEKFNAEVPPETLSRFLFTLDHAGLLDNENSSVRKKSKNKPEKRLRGGLMLLRYKILNPENILNWLIHRVRFLFTPTFVAISAATIFLSILITVENWSEYIDDVPRLFRLEAIPVYMVLGFIVVSGHEFAHGLTCRHFGGKVKEMGFMLMYFQPAFYCNVSDAWLFPEKSKRLWVGFAGMYFEFFVWAIAVMLWRITDTDTFINYAALMIMTGSGIATLANLNPMIKLDGYYLLSDYLDVPNLRKKSFKYIGDSLKSFVGLAERPGEGVSRRDRRLFIAYGLTSTLASFSLMTIATFEVGAYLIEQSQPWALSLFLGLVGTRFNRRLRRLFGKPTKGDEDFDDDGFSLTEKSAADKSTRETMRDKYNDFAPPVHGDEDRRQYKLRPAQSDGALPAAAREESRSLKPQTPPHLDDFRKPEPLKRIPAIPSNGSEGIDSSGPPREKKKEKSSRSSSRQKKKKRKINPIVLGFVAAFALIILFFGWRELRITGPFNILPIQYADVRAEVEGLIDEVLVKEGDFVKQGDIIARISDRQYRAQVQQTQADIDRAQAELRILEIGPSKVEIDVAQTAVKRAKEYVEFERPRVERSKLLYEKDILSLNEYESALQQLNSAENDLIEAERRLTALVRGIRPEQIRAARANLEGLEVQMRAYALDLQRVEIRSPVSGVVSTPARQLRELVYQRVERGALIARISDPKKLRVEIAVSEKDVADVRVGQAVGFKARAYPDEMFNGVVTATAQTASNGTGTAQTPNAAPASSIPSSAATILVTSVIDNSSLMLKPGMSGYAKIYCGERRVISLMFRRFMQTIKVEFWSWW